MSEAKLPIFCVQPTLLRWLSKLAPIEIEAITLGFVVLSRRPLSPAVQQHERIHFWQYVELLFVLFPVVYLFDFLFLLARHRDGKKAYLGIRMEQEAYAHMYEQDYCQKRRAYAWFWNYRL